MQQQKLLSLIRQAIEDYNMIEEGDKIAVGVSGGKDSLALLHAMKILNRFYPKKFELYAITCNVGFEGMDFTGVRQFCESLNVPYEQVDTEIATIVFEDNKDERPCSLCVCCGIGCPPFKKTDYIQIMCLYRTCDPSKGDSTYPNRE